MAINAGMAVGYLDIDTSKFSAGLKTAQSQLSSFSDNSLSASQKFTSMGNGLKTIGSTLTKTVTLPLVGVGTAAVATAANFEKSMDNVAALSGATGKDLEDLTNLAKQMGETTQFSASEAADALGYMALAGWDTQESMNGLPGVLNLAASSGMGLAEASDMVTDYLSAFGEEADQAGRMADVLAYAQANSNTTTQGLGEAFKNCAVNANAFGMDIEQTTAVLGKLADQGLKGSEAGTALNAVFRDMSSEMKDGAIQIGDTAVKITDANGNFKDMSDIVRAVSKATDGLSESERMAALQSTFTADSIKAMGILTNVGADEIAEFTNNLYESSGAASEMASAMNDNLNGQLTLLKSALEGAAISIGESLMPMIKDLVSWINGLVDWFNNLSPSVKQTIVVVAGLAAAAGPLLMIIGQISIGIGALAPLFSFLISPIGLVIAVIGLLVAAGVALYNNWDIVKEKCGEVWSYVCDSISNFVSESIQWVKDKWEECKLWLSNCWNTVKDSAIEIWNNIGNFFTETIPQWVSNITNWFNELPYNIGFALGTVLGSIVQWGIDTWNYLATNVPKWIEGVSKWFSELPGKIWNWLTQAIQKISQWGAETYSKAIEGATKTINGIIQWFSQLPGKIWNWLTQAIQKMGQWATNMAQKGKEAADRTVSNVINGFTSLPGKVAKIGSDAVKSLWNGISSMASWITNKISGFVSGIVNGFSGITGKVASKVGKTIDEPYVARSVQGREYEAQDYSTVQFNYSRAKQTSLSDAIAKSSAMNDVLSKLDSSFRSTKVSGDTDNKFDNTYNINLNIDKMVNSDDRSIEDIANQLAFYLKRKNVALGGVR